VTTRTATSNAKLKVDFFEITSSHASSSIVVDGHPSSQIPQRQHCPCAGSSTHIALAVLRFTISSNFVGACTPRPFSGSAEG
jgi:hypothetical protein